MAKENIMTVKELIEELKNATKTLKSELRVVMVA